MLDESPHSFFDRSSGIEYAQSPAINIHRQFIDWPTSLFLEEFPIHFSTPAVMTSFELSHA